MSISAFTVLRRNRVETLEELRALVAELIGLDYGHPSTVYVSPSVEVLVEEETLSDGSTVHNVTIR